MTTKDLFSGHAGLYAAFRPTYPDELFDFILKHVDSHMNAWDCATGNGQVAFVLSRYFKQVHATDISQTQLDHAQQAMNINYGISTAEKTTFPDHHFDLITVAQAFHWFDPDKFFTEAKRVLKPNGLMAIWGYGLLSIDKQCDEAILHFYKNIVGPYWDRARKLVDEGYRESNFPFKKIDTPSFSIRVSWTLKHLAGYLESWSATQRYIKEKQMNPVTPFIDQLRNTWHDQEEKLITFPIFLAMGKW
ncbi:class I SAM-dependent methyltransferase [Pseudochryseolinea flava]|uniref:SAM-dependent methyltransferase n=1 Tax=Pseudochryseolinea flava TaxID=2059302 RepID=A0A364XXG5_9BACT|nr:class I SAM-dependent methyltransferase [Pseudochryseolinea flava]RAV99134.1 SAM-dependent methyltransferase [Pseudochryseolinea flava]